MKKVERIEVTDFMVDAAVGAKYPNVGLLPQACIDVERMLARRMLEAAFGAPPEPEILVTEEMLKAGEREQLRIHSAGRFAALTAIYRAMRKLEKPQCELVHCKHFWEVRAMQRLVHDGKTDYRCTICGAVERR